MSKILLWLQNRVKHPSMETQLPQINGNMCKNILDIKQLQHEKISFRFSNQNRMFFASQLQENLPSAVHIMYTGINSDRRLRKLHIEHIRPVRNLAGRILFSSYYLFLKPNLPLGVKLKQFNQICRTPPASARGPQVQHHVSGLPGCAVGNWGVHLLLPGLHCASQPGLLHHP